MTTPQGESGASGTVRDLPTDLSTIRSILPSPLKRALDFEAEHSTHHLINPDPFYTISPEQASAAPGTLLKLETSTDTSRYTLPPATALSRFIYQSTTLSGRHVPVSGYILWPFSPRRWTPSSGDNDSSSSSGSYQMVAYAHGTSGMTPSSAPSATHNLWQHFLAPFQLALSGYVVVATDYAGLGVAHDAHGAAIAHEYLASRAQGNDLLYSVLAARQAFPKELAGGWVAAGHSQGGGAAWSLAQRLAAEAETASSSDSGSGKDTEGQQQQQPLQAAARVYLGAVALSPIVGVLNEKDPIRSVLVAAGTPGVEAYVDGWQRERVLTDEGLRRLEVIQRLGAMLAPSFALLTGIGLLKEGWEQDEGLVSYYRENENGGKKIVGPMLVVYGEEDHILNVEHVNGAVKRTMDKFPDTALRFVRVPGVTHNAALTSTQWLWMDWIRERFEGKEPGGYQETVLESARETKSYQREVNWYVERAAEFYHTP